MAGAVLLREGQGCTRGAPAAWSGEVLWLPRVSGPLVAVLEPSAPLQLEVGAGDEALDLPLARLALFERGVGDPLDGLRLPLALPATVLVGGHVAVRLP